MKTSKVIGVVLMVIALIGGIMLVDVVYNAEHNATIMVICVTIWTLGAYLFYRRAKNI